MQYRGAVFSEFSEYYGYYQVNTIWWILPSEYFPVNTTEWLFRV